MLAPWSGRATLDELLRGILVEDAMETDITGVPATMTLDTFAGQVLDTPGGTVPVTDGHALVGVLGARDIRRIRRANWPSTRAGDLMRSTEALPEVAPSTSLRDRPATSSSARISMASRSWMRVGWPAS